MSHRVKCTLCKEIITVAAGADETQSLIEHVNRRHPKMSVIRSSDPQRKPLLPISETSVPSQSAERLERVKTLNGDGSAASKASSDNSKKTNSKGKLTRSSLLGKKSVASAKDTRESKLSAEANRVDDNASSKLADDPSKAASNATQNESSKGKLVRSSFSIGKKSSASVNDQDKTDVDETSTMASSKAAAKKSSKGKLTPSSLSVGKKSAVSVKEPEKTDGTGTTAVNSSKPAKENSKRKLTRSSFSIGKKSAAADQNAGKPEESVASSNPSNETSAFEKDPPDLPSVNPESLSENAAKTADDPSKTSSNATTKTSCFQLPCIRKKSAASKAETSDVGVTSEATLKPSDVKKAEAELSKESSLKSKTSTPKRRASIASDPSKPPSKPRFSSFINPRKSESLAMPASEPPVKSRKKSVDAVEAPPPNHLPDEPNESPPKASESKTSKTSKSSKTPKSSRKSKPKASESKTSSRTSETPMTPLQLFAEPPTSDPLVDPDGTGANELLAREYLTKVAEADSRAKRRPWPPENSAVVDLAEEERQAEQCTRELKHKKAKKRRYSTAIETWRPGKSCVQCRRCGAAGVPTVRRVDTRNTRSLYVTSCVLSLWPLCFMPGCYPAATIEMVHCGACGYRMGEYDSRTGKTTPTKPKLVNGTRNEANGEAKVEPAPPVNNNARKGRMDSRMSKAERTSMVEAAKGDAAELVAANESVRMDATPPADKARKRKGLRLSTVEPPKGDGGAAIREMTEPVAAT